jgi:hypothetical protein
VLIADEAMLSRFFRLFSRLKRDDLLMRLSRTERDVGAVDGVVEDATLVRELSCAATMLEVRRADRVRELFGSEWYRSGVSEESRLSKACWWNGWAGW